MPDFWQFPTVSMGLGPLHAIYQARFNRYLLNRGIKDTSQQRVWAFLGDGETDEPESLGNISLAAREGLDNLTFVINCNLQRLDGPVRGNGNIIQELESNFRGAGWNVIKVIWGRGWDRLLARDTDGALVALMNNTPDGDYQTYRGEDVAFLRKNFFGRDPRVAAMVADIPDDQLWALKRGGMDYRKLYSAYRTAVSHTGQPTVILAKTIKGWSLGQHFESRNATHQMKKLSLEDLRTFRDRLHIPIPDSQLDKYLPPYYNPGPDDPQIQYMMERRAALGGSMPRRQATSRPLAQPAAEDLRHRHARLGQAGGRHDDGLRPAVQGPHARPGDRLPVRPDHPRRGAHVRHGRAVPDAEDLQPEGPELPVGGPRADAVVQGGHQRPDPARGHRRGRLGGVVRGRRDRRTPPTTSR